MATIHAACEDALAPCVAADANAEMPALMAEIVRKAVTAGYGDKQMSAVIKVLR